MALDLKPRERLRAVAAALGGALSRCRSHWLRTPPAGRALAVALCLAPTLSLAFAFSRGASGAPTGEGDPFRASTRMQRLLAPASEGPEKVAAPARPAAEEPPPAPPSLRLRGRLQMREGPLVVLLEVEGLRGLQRLSAGETLAIQSGGRERSLRLVDGDVRDLWVSMDGGAPVALR